ncbi:MAG: hypothetical protein OCU24_05230 [Candidatus Methanospirare jalkutatii]|nr:hypothetical protein [Candidatus Methanospirare jalkutatii]
MSGVRDARLRIARVFALGQQEDMWLAIARPNLPTANFTYPQNVK